MKHGNWVLAGWALLLAACTSAPVTTAGDQYADLVLTNGRVYTLAWAEPSLDGKPAPDAPHDKDGWHPDAEAVAIRSGRIVYVGDNDGARRLVGANTQVMNLDGNTLLPGLVDSHTHIFGLGAKLSEVDLSDVATEEQAVARVAKHAATVTPGEWIIGYGWDEGAWANNYPNKTLLSDAVPDHPVVLNSLHGFAAWVNQRALDQGRITARSAVPVGGEMRLGTDGEPTGLFLNNATTMIDAIVPLPTDKVLAVHALAGLNQMAADGYVTVHDAGLDAARMRVLEQLESQGRLPIRVYAMLSLRDEDLINQWIARGPDKDNDSMLVTRSVKAYYDGALGSRGARLLEDYADKPGHRGVSGSDYGFNRALNARAMKAGFQVGIHAIGDAGNRESLDILEQVFDAHPATAGNRHRIEHAQIIHPDDIPRLGQLELIASMEPPHAMEDKTWAEDRLGLHRMAGAYAWRSLRQHNTRLTFNSDNPGSDHNIFYGLHSAVTRQDKNGEPPGGWYPAERMSIDEAVRGYTSWSAYAGFREDDTGKIEQGRWADISVVNIDPFVLAETKPAELLRGEVLLTIVNGEVVYER